MNYSVYDKGQYRTTHLTEDTMWGAFSMALSGRSRHAASYKFGFLKSILDNLYEVDENLTLSFDQLFGKFAEIYWNLILKYHLRQSPDNVEGNTTYLEQTLLEAKSKYMIPEDTPYESLTYQMALDINSKVKSRCKNNVVGALFGDTQELFYSFDKKSEWLRINPQMYTFVCKHKLVIEKLNYFEWAKYLEKVNSSRSSDHLLTKIDESTLRSNLNRYRKILEDEFESHNCFYCGRKLNAQNTHVDHFIPWSFIKSDDIWNFVLSCNTCNIKKNDKLAERYYLKELLNRNSKYDILRFASNYSPKKLEDAYDWAKSNGYSTVWRPA